MMIMGHAVAEHSDMEKLMGFVLFFLFIFSFIPIWLNSIMNMTFTHQHKGERRRLLDTILSNQIA